MLRSPEVIGAKSLARSRLIAAVAILPSLLVLIAIYIYPIGNLKTRSLTIAAILFLCTGLLIFAWNRKVLRWVLIVMAAAITLFTALPSRNPDRSGLQAAFARSLLTYEGVKYVWGGENHRGIDCSGLIRRAFMDACLREGAHQADPGLIRLAMYIWWHDCSAAELGTGYRGLTLPVTTATSINSMDPSSLQPGDLAVTRTGVHVLAYMGNSRWVEADPDLHRVVNVSIPAPGNAWFNYPVRIVRWSILDSTHQAPAR